MSSSASDAITALRPLPSDPDEISVRVGRRTVARLPIAAIARLELRVGLPWTDELAARAAHERDVARVHRAATRLLAARPYTVAALESRLARRAFPADAIRTVLDALRTTGALDDDAVARDTIERRLERQPMAPERLRATLERHGVEEDVALRTVDDAFRGRDLVDDALAASASTRRRLDGLAPAVQVRRLAGFLARRGYDEDTVRAVLDATGLDRAVEDDGFA